MHSFSDLYFRCLGHTPDTHILPDQEPQRDHKKDDRAQFVAHVCWISALQGEKGDDFHYQGTGSNEDLMTNQ